MILCDSLALDTSLTDRTTAAQAVAPPFNIVVVEKGSFSWRRIDFLRMESLVDNQELSHHDLLEMLPKVR